MKIFVSLFICAFVCCLLIQVNAVCTTSPFNGTDISESMTFHEGYFIETEKCTSLICDHGKWSHTRCYNTSCTNHIDYRGYDYSKPFPYCCPSPVCKQHQE